MSDFQEYLDMNLSEIKFVKEDAEYKVPEYDIYAEIRKMLKKAREEKGITQKELSEKTGLTQSNISNIEKGVSKPTIDSLKKIADALGRRLYIDFGYDEV